MGKKKVSVLIFHDELCQVFNGLMTALSLLREGSDVTLFFGSRGINVVHKEKIKELKCMPDQPQEIQDRIMAKMDEMALPTPEDMMTMLEMEGALLLACPLNKDLFEFKDEDIIEGVSIADPTTFYADVMVPADMVLSF
ncbi:MAG: DsrE/DsrF/DrsH-like family protein [Candidatus Hydrothermarchaeaceae archaeon]